MEAAVGEHEASGAPSVSSHTGAAASSYLVTSAFFSIRVLGEKLTQIMPTKFGCNREKA